MAGKTIVLQGETGVYREGQLNAAVSPGMALEKDVNGEFGPVAAAQAEALKRAGGFPIAIEDGFQGRTVNDAYLATDKVFTYTPVPGDKVQLLVKAGEDIDVAEKLVPEGGGSGLWVAAAGTEAAYSFEADEDSGGVLAADTLLSATLVA